MQVRTPILLLVAGAALGVAQTGWSLPMVAGGSAVQIQQAPWTVYIAPEPGANGLVCDGVIIDSSHIVTAAHCVYSSSGARVSPSGLEIDAGVSKIQAPYPTDSQQLIHGVASIRVHPGYKWSGTSASADDVAVVTLTAPLDLSGQAVQALALPSATAAYPAGMSVSLAGFGLQTPGATSSGLLNRFTATVDKQGSCGTATAVNAGDATVFCAQSPGASVCEGDSGSGLVTTSSTPTLLGIVSLVPGSCALGSHGIYINVGAPEILQFLQGNDHPATAPRNGSVNVRWKPPLKAGATLTCSSTGWTGQPKLIYAFVNARTSQVLKRGASPSYVVGKSALGSKLTCTVSATNAGGTTVLTSASTPAI